MKLPNHIKMTCFFIAMLLGTSLLAQHHRGGKRMGMDLERLKTQLELTDDQEAQLMAIEKKYEAKMQALLEVDMQDEEEAMDAMHALRKAKRAEVKEVFTEEQLATLKANKEAHKEKMKEMREARKVAREEMKAYQKENIKPVMLEQRAKLDTKISEEDQATIATLRVEMKQRKARMEKKMDDFMKGEKADKTARGKRGKGKGKGAHKNSEHRETIKALVEKYQNDIQSLLAEIEPQQKVWKAEMKAIHDKHMPEDPNMQDGMHRGRKYGPLHEMEGKGERHKMRKMAHFLLLDPNNPEETVLPEQTQGALTEVRIFPNPATTQNTITYTVMTAGQVRIELHSEDGNSLKVIVDAYREAGEYTEQVDLSNLLDGAYYYSILDQQGITTKAVIVSRQ